eukprot:Filipodium_phascolosomae@DN1250_c0_g1_i2.p1
MECGGVQAGQIVSELGKVLDASVDTLTKITHLQPPDPYFLPASFHFIPQRPEEVGEWWLPRRKGFNVTTWRAKCKCKHSHEEHRPNRPYRCTQCGCQDFYSAFLCIGCDKHWEDHETLFETESERKTDGRPIKDAFFPFFEYPELEKEVFHVTPSQDTEIYRPRQGTHLHGDLPIPLSEILPTRPPGYQRVQRPNRLENNPANRPG